MESIRIIVVGVDPEAIELIQEMPEAKLVGIIDRSSRVDGLGIPYLGDDSNWPTIREQLGHPHVCIAIDQPELRSRLFHFYSEAALRSVIAPSASISKSATIGNGCLIQNEVKILARATIGSGCKVNRDAVIHHDCRIGPWCTIAPGARLLGGVCVHERTFIGANATVLPKVKIGEGCVVGAGAVVTKDVKCNTTVAGVPARTLYLIKPKVEESKREQNGE